MKEEIKPDFVEILEIIKHIDREYLTTIGGSEIIETDVIVALGSDNNIYRWSLEIGKWILYVKE